MTLQTSQLVDFHSRRQLSFKIIILIGLFSSPIFTIAQEKTVTEITVENSQND